MISRDDVKEVLAIAARTLGNPDRRASKANRDAALDRLASAAQRGEPAATLDAMEAEFRAANAEHARVMGWKREDA